MRIKEKIKKAGVFWLPTYPQNQIPGTLSISDGGNVKLEIAQSLDPSIQAQLGGTPPDSLNPILGHVENDGPIIIDQCYRTEKKSNIAQGSLIAPEVIWADRILTRLSYDENPDLLFHTLTFSVEGLDEWVDTTGIDVDEQIENGSLTISYNCPDDISINLHNGMQLLIIFAWTPPGFPRTKRAEVRQKTFFKLISKDPCVLDNLISVAQKITAFLCLVMNEIVCLDRIAATFNSYCQDIGNGRTAPIPVQIYSSSWPYVKNEPEINELDMLFKFKRIRDRAEKIVSNWIKDYEQIVPALDLYFLTKTGTLPTMNIQFLTLVQALEAFHRSTSDEKHMDKSEFKAIRRKMLNECPEEHKEWFGIKLMNGNELTLRDRIEKLIEPFDCLIDDERRPKLITHIAKTRNSLTHYDKKSERKAAEAVLLQFLCRKMNTLFQLQFLQLIGFDEQEINEIIDECPYFKGECNL